MSLRKILQYGAIASAVIFGGCKVKEYIVPCEYSCLYHDTERDLKQGQKDIPPEEAILLYLRQPKRYLEDSQERTFEKLEEIHRESLDHIIDNETILSERELTQRKKDYKIWIRIEETEEEIQARWKSYDLRKFH